MVRSVIKDILVKLHFSALEFGWAVLCKCFLFTVKAPWLFMPVMYWGRKNLPSSAALCPHYYTSLQDSHFPIIPHSVRPLLSTLMDQMDWRPAPSTLRLSLSPSLYYTVCLWILSFFSSSSFLTRRISLFVSPLPSHIFFKSCFLHFGSAVHKSFVISLWCSLARLRQPVVWFSFNLIFVQSDTLYVSASVSCTQFGHSEFSSQPWTSLFMRENGIKLVHYRLQYFWPSILFSLAVALKVCWNGPFFMSLNGLFSWIHKGMVAFWRDL